MVLNPQSVRSVEALANQMSVLDPDYSIETERRQARALAAASAREAVDHVVDVDADGVPTRFYRPVDAPTGLVLHLHGGGFVFNDVDTHDASVRRLANRSGLAVLSIDYRRPPEHRFPAAPDDVSTVVAWLGAGGLPELGLADGVPLFAHGDSAGANLALVAALRHPGTFAAVALIYPFLDPQQAAASWTDEQQGFTGAEAGWYWEQYASSPADLTDPDLAPLLNNRLGTLPPTLVVTAEHDPCRGDGEELAVRLAEAGVSVVATRYLGLVHGFWRHPAAFDAAEPLMGQVAAFLRQHV